MWMSSLWVTWKMTPVVASIAVHLAASIQQHRLALRSKSHSETQSADEQVKTACCPLLFWSRRKQKREYLKVLFLPLLHWCSAPALSHCTQVSIFCCLKCHGIIRCQNFRPLIPLNRFQTKRKKIMHRAAHSVRFTSTPGVAAAVRRLLMGEKSSCTSQGFNS